MDISWVVHFSNPAVLGVFTQHEMEWVHLPNRSIDLHLVKTPSAAGNRFAFLGAEKGTLIYDHPMTNPKPELSDPCAEILALCQKIPHFRSFCFFLAPV